MVFQDKVVLITGGTGSLGKKLISRIMEGSLGIPKKIIVFSRDEAKQYQMRLELKNKLVVADKTIYMIPEDVLEFQIGDVRDYQTVFGVVIKADIIINAAALKQVPTCEYFPYEAVRTNVQGAHNIVTAIRDSGSKVETVVGISTDKACKPVNVMGMTKSIQERILMRGNIDCAETRFICVRYGNILASRGSVIPLFLDQIALGGPVTITTKEMTRFLLSLDQAIDLIFDAIRYANKGETYIPRVPSANIMDIADVLIGDRKIEKNITGIRPGEKIHEVLISEEERYRTVENRGYYVVESLLPEIRSKDVSYTVLNGEYTSAENLISKENLYKLFEENGLLDFSRIANTQEILV